MPIRLLYTGETPEFQVLPPVFFGDLKLDDLVKAITSKYSEYDIRKIFYTLPRKAETAEYRKQIYHEFSEKPQLVLAAKRYMTTLSATEKKYRYYLQSEEAVQKGSYLLLVCHDFLKALTDFYQALEQEQPLESQGLLSLYESLGAYLSQSDTQSFQEKIQKSFSAMKEMNLTLQIKRGEIVILEQMEEESPHTSVLGDLLTCLQAFDHETYPPAEKDMDLNVYHLFPAPLETNSLENSIVEVLKKNKPEIFKIFQEFSTETFALTDSPWFQLKNDLAFYVSFYEFEQGLNQVGITLCESEIKENAPFRTDAVFDLALAWKNRFFDYEIVKNDIHMLEDKNFFVITGPNQGGKTTLARGLGQAVYFMMMGLKSPCKSLCGPFYSNLLTHFEVEESLESGAGKLKEELNRLKPMMASKFENQFVIINELFTTATTYDATVMAGEVLRHFYENHCYGVYVTHIREIAEEREFPFIQSMVAQVDAAGNRTYKILHQKPEGLGYSDALTNKYHLTANQVRERLQHMEERGEKL